MQPERPDPRSVSARELDFFRKKLTMHVVMNVTKMTQTPYALPKLVVYTWLSCHTTQVGVLLTLLYTAVTMTVPIINR